MAETRFSTRDMVMVALFAALTVVLGFLYIPLPFTPVPVTGQSLGAMLAGCILGRRLGPLSMAVFLALAAAGVPVLAGGRGGLGVLVGPSGGYLAGFVIGAFLIGVLTERLRNRQKSFWSILIANAIGGIVGIHAPGMVYLAFATHRNLFDALVIGSVPFLPGDLLKVLAAAVIAQGVYAAYPVERLFIRSARSVPEMD